MSDKEFVDNELITEELQIVARQSRVLIDRYNLKTHTVERFADFKRQHTGVPHIRENVPRSVIESGIVSADTVDMFLGFYEEMYQGKPFGCVDVRMKAPSGEYLWFHGEYTLLYGKENEPEYAICTFMDNTKKREMEQASEKWRRNLASILSESILYVEVNLTQNIIDRQEGSAAYIRHGKAAESLEAFTDYGAANHFISQNKKEYYDFFDRKRLIGLFYEKVYDDNFDYCIFDEAGGSFWIQANIGIMKYPYSDDVMAIISYMNIDQQRKELEQLTKMASQDALTGILNRKGFDKQVQTALESFQPPDTIALFIIDLDNFKQVNDRLGHQTGDTVLKQTACTLLEYFPDDIVGRLGGDEYVVFLSGCFGQQDLKSRAKGLLEALQFEIGGNKRINISASIGIAFGKGKITFEKLYRKSDIALYTAKKAGKSRYHLINTDTDQDLPYMEEQKENDLLPLQTLLEYIDDGTKLFKVGESKDKSPYEALIETIPGGVAVMELTSSSEELQITHCNNWIYFFTGYTKDETASNQKKGFLSYVCSDDYDKLQKAFDDVKNGVNLVSISYRLLHKDGYYKYVNLNTVVTERKPNRIIMHGVYIDVDNAMKMQNELERSRLKLESIISALPGGIAIYEITDTFIVTYCNDWIYQYTGYSKAEFQKYYQYNMLAIVCEEDLPRVNETILEARNGKDSIHIEFHLVHKSEGKRHININAQVIERTDEKVTMYGIYYE